METAYILFGLGQLILFVVFVLKMNTRIVVMEKQCEDCRKGVAEKFRSYENEYDSDLEEIKADIKDLKLSNTEIKLSIARIETMLSGKVVQL